MKKSKRRIGSISTSLERGAARAAALEQGVSRRVQSAKKKVLSLQNVAAFTAGGVAGTVLNGVASNLPFTSGPTGQVVLAAAKIGAGMMIYYNSSGKAAQQFGLGMMSAGGLEAGNMIAKQVLGKGISGIPPALPARVNQLTQLPTTVRRHYRKL